MPEFLIGDPQRVSQALYNLMSHTVRASTGSTISFGVDVADSGSEQVELSFTISYGGQQDGEATHASDQGDLSVQLASKLIGLLGGQLSIERVKHENYIARFKLAFQKPQ